jgi:hypothetical protein
MAKLVVIEGTTLPFIGAMLRPMARMPKEVAEYLRKLGKRYGKLGGQTAAKNMTAEERSARAKKASDAAAKKRTAERLARERAAKARKRR